MTQADGTGSTDRLTSSAHVQFLDSWHSDGSVVAFTQNDPETGNDVWLLTLDGSGAQLLLGTAFNEYGAAFSPDGNWLAYTSDETGRDEIYVQPFPGTGGMWQVSAEGGRQPTWAPDGRVLYYRSRGRFVAVELGTRREFTAGRPRQLVDLPVPLDEGTVTSVRNYDVAPDGGGIVVVRAGEYRAPTRIHVILNWVEELRSRMATSGR